jgi:hypothetical protein
MNVELDTEAVRALVSRIVRQTLGSH